MDLNMGTVLEDESLEAAGERLFSEILATASGRRPRASYWGMAMMSFALGPSADALEV